MGVLKEVDFDLPYEKDEKAISELMVREKMTHQEATRNNYETVWHSKRMQFRDECRSICNIYISLLGKVIVPNGKKLLIECVKEKGVGKIIKNFSGVLTVEVEWDEVLYFSSTSYDKKQMVLNYILEALTILAGEWDLDIVPFQQAYEKVIALDYKNEFVWKQKINRKEKTVGELFCVFELDYFDAYLRIKKDGQVIAEKHAFRTKPNEWAYYELLGELKWVDSQQLVLIDDDQQVVSALIQPNEGKK